MAGSLEQKTNQAEKNIVLLSSAWCKRIAMGQRIVGGACWNIVCQDVSGKDGKYWHWDGRCFSLPNTLVLPSQFSFAQDVCSYLLHLTDALPSRF